MQKKIQIIPFPFVVVGGQGIQDLCGCSHTLVRVVKAEAGVRPQDVGEGLGVQCGQKAGARAV